MYLFIQKGEDKSIELPLLDGGEPVKVGPELSELFHDITLEILVGNTCVPVKYAFAAQSGYSSLFLHNTIDNVLLFKLGSSDTKFFPYGVIKVRVTIYWKDLDYPEGRVQIITIPIGRITP